MSIIGSCGEHLHPETIKKRLSQNQWPHPAKPAAKYPFSPEEQSSGGETLSTGWLEVVEGALICPARQHH